MAFNNYLEDENDKPYFTTNSLAYYYDKMEGFAKAVEGSAKALNLTKEEIEQRIALRLAEWDKNLESFDSSVETLLTEWVDDGTLTHVIDSTLIEQKIAPVTARLGDTEKKLKRWVDVTEKPFNAKFNGVTDDTLAIQGAIDYVSSIGGGVVSLPVGKTIITGTLTIKKNVQLIGAGSNFGIAKALTEIRHQPLIADTDLFLLDQSSLDSGYISGISIKFLNIYGNANSRHGFDLVRPSNLTMENILIYGFSEGMKIDTSINCRFTNIDVRYSRVVCMRFYGGVSTSTTIHNSYLHFSPTPLIVEQKTALGVVFTDQTLFESCDNGIDIYPGNHLSFTNCYAENIPRQPSPVAIFNFGVNGTVEPDYQKGSCIISGGVYHGTNGGLRDAGSSIFRVDKWSVLTVTGIKMARAGNTIIKNNAKAMVSFNGTYEEQIDVRLFVPTVQLGVLINGSNTTTNNNPFIATGQIHFNNRGKWTVKEVFSETDADLQFASNGLVSLWLDGKGSVRHPNAFYTSPMRIGGIRLWDDGLGQLRMKNGSDPVNETDGITL